ncbi:MAG: nitrilase-related carbon-nitrogen hydrolase [Candidatus Korarchaeota archaeon]|nr:nitrilase-related carbon-nitrogen hydrolase [Candidatus Korarchaeota archaeon]
MRASRIALAQMSVSDGGVSENVDRALAMGARAGRSDADLLLLPEMWCTGYDRGAIERFSSPSSVCVSAMRYLAEEHGMLVAGTVPLKERDGIANALLLVDEKGRVAARYDKIHPFPLFQEHLLFKAGDRAVVADTRIGRLGFATCYDLRFPELARVYGLSRVGVLVVPAAWGRPRLQQWIHITRARAAENQFFLAAANRWGPSAVINEEFAGHSVVVDPWGDPVIEVHLGDNLGLADLDLDEIARVREKLPLYRSRRPEAYRLGERQSE